MDKNLFPLFILISVIGVVFFSVVLWFALSWRKEIKKVLKECAKQEKKP